MAESGRLSIDREHRFAARTRAITGVRSVDRVACLSTNRAELLEIQEAEEAS
jgi:hypothetical protein